MPTLQETYYTVRQAAKKLGLSYHTFLARAHRDVYKIERVDNVLLFRREEIDKHANAGVVEKTTR